MIQIITTGGTIDKSYNKLKGSLVFTGSYINKILQKANLTIDYKVTNLLQKDSLDFTNDDVRLIYDACKSSKYERIIVIHGTDTMATTAKRLINIANKTIVLTGAMIPYTINDSDASFNVGYALSCVQQLQFGTYIAMNGRVFKAGQTIKNTRLGIFDSL